MWVILIDVLTFAVLAFGSVFVLAIFENRRTLAPAHGPDVEARANALRHMIASSRYVGMACAAVIALSGVRMIVADEVHLLTLITVVAILTCSAVLLALEARWRHELKRTLS